MCICSCADSCSLFTVVKLTSFECQDDRGHRKTSMQLLAMGTTILDTFLNLPVRVQVRTTSFGIDRLCNGLLFSLLLAPTCVSKSPLVLLFPSSRRGFPCRLLIQRRPQNLLLQTSKLVYATRYPSLVPLPPPRSVFLSTDSSSWTIATSES